MTAVHDTCAKPAVIDLSLLGLSSDVVFTVNASGANADYATSLAAAACAGDPDLVVLFVGSPGHLTMRCTGGGSVCFTQNDTTPGTCPLPSSGVNKKGSVNCSGSISTASSIPTGTFYALFYRSASAGTGTVTLSP